MANVGRDGNLTPKDSVDLLWSLGNRPALFSRIFDRVVDQSVDKLGPLPSSYKGEDGDEGSLEPLGHLRQEFFFVVHNISCSSCNHLVCLEDNPSDLVSREPLVAVTHSLC